MKMRMRVNDQFLEDYLIKHDGVTAVAFMSYTTIPCGHFLPEFKTVAEEMKDRLGFFILDTDENPTLTDELGVMAVPTTLVFRDAEEIGRLEGPYSKEALKERLGNMLLFKKGP